MVDDEEDCSCDLSCSSSSIASEESISETERKEMLVMHDILSLLVISVYISIYLLISTLRYLFYHHSQ